MWGKRNLHAEDDTALFVAELGQKKVPQFIVYIFSEARSMGQKGN